MTRAAGLALLLLLLGGCRSYAPVFDDCRLRCGAGGECPHETSCVEGFCRRPDAPGGCECAPGERSACPAPAACVAEPRTCGDDGRWGPCAGPVTTREVCNGLDDDCDGVVDEAPHDVACALTLGVCAGHFEGCAAGQPVACTAASYGPDYERLERSCDGLDNDCDGVTDGWPERTLGPGARLRLLGQGEALVAVVELGDGGLGVQRLDAALEPLGAPVPTAAVLEAVALVDDALVVARAVDGGLELQRAGEASLLPLAEAVTTVHLAGPSLAAVAGGEVLVARWLADGGLSAPQTLGLADGGPLALSSTGGHLAWPGGVTRVDDGALLVDGGAGLVALAERADGGLVGVRLAPGVVARVDDVHTGAAEVLLSWPTSGAPPQLSLGLLDDEPVVALVTGATAALFGRSGRRDVEGGATALVLAPENRGLLRLGRASGGTLRVSATCGP